MSATVQASRLASQNRRRLVRQKVHVPAYASFNAASKSEMLDLYEILDISEAGVAVHCSSPLPVDQAVDLCLDLAEAGGQISATARVVWSDAAGRVGFSLPALPNAAARRLQQWLFLNAMVAATNAASAPAPSNVSQNSILRQNYTDMLAAAAAVQKQAESLGDDLEAVLSLVASRSQSLLRASGAAIALAGKDSATMIGQAMICCASAGQNAPPVGATLEVGSGFSGECVRTGKILRCDDADTDQRVDRAGCRALGLRSMLAAPIRSGQRVIGVLEAFSTRPGAFHQNDEAVLQRFTDTIAAAVDRARLHDGLHVSSPLPTPLPAPTEYFSPPGSVLFGQPPEEVAEEVEAADKNKLAGIHLPRVHLLVLIAAAATIALVLVITMAPRILRRLQSRARSEEQTVLASSPAADISKSHPALPSLDSADPKQLRELATHDNPAAENALGLLYSEGDEKHAIKPNESEAARWFTRAAEHGSVAAQYKMGLLCWGGHGVPKDLNRAYFWAVLARAGGQEGSRDLANVLASGMTRSQAAVIEQQAEAWYQQHLSQAKPQAGR